MGVPTDCPNRDERTGCTGDHQFFMPTAVYNADVAAFFNKWLVDLCQDSQSTNGVFADVAPYYGRWPGPSDAWGDAGIICPYVFFRTYGDTQIIAEHYEAMRHHHAFLVTTSTNYLRSLSGPGDWLNLGGTAKKEVIATAYFAWLTGLMADMAQAIGRSGDAAEYRALEEKIKTAFAKAFIASDGSIEDSSQTGYALAFTMGLVPPECRLRMAGRFVAEVERFDGHPAVGFIGVPRLLPGLHEAGRDDVACRLLCQQTYPSWLFMVKNGATTIWERWDTFVPGKGFQEPGMNSFNHVVWGAVGEYLYGMIGGIRAESPGYKIIHIQPAVCKEITWAKTSYDSIRGRISTAWNAEGGRLRLNLTIPANTTALVFMPAKDAAAVTESGKPASKAAGVKFLRMENGAAVYAVESGSYSFAE
jgi:alpha-L-rhamnosidase